MSKQNSRSIHHESFRYFCYLSLTYNFARLPRRIDAPQDVSAPRNDVLSISC